MIHQKTFLLSIATTAFLVVLVGGVYAAYVQIPPNDQAQMTVEDVLNDPDVQAVLREREAEYQRMLEEANQRLASTSETAMDQSEDVIPISVDLAVALGQNTLGGGTLIRQPELVNLNGRAAYELIFDRGQVYIDAVSGAILYNTNAISQLANSGGSYREREDNEHEDFDD